MSAAALRLPALLFPRARRGGRRFCWWVLPPGRPLVQRGSIDACATGTDGAVRSASACDGGSASCRNRRSPGKAWRGSQRKAQAQRFQNLAVAISHGRPPEVYPSDKHLRGHPGAG